MRNINKQQLYETALFKWGETAQLIMLIEECGELIQAVAKSFRENNKEDVIEELVDVEIMLEQIRLIYGSKEINKKKIEKLNYLERLISEDT